MKEKVLEKMSLSLGAVVSTDDELCPGTSPVIIIGSISQLSLTCIIQMFQIIPYLNL